MICDLSFESTGRDLAARTPLGDPGSHFKGETSFEVLLLVSSPVSALSSALIVSGMALSMYKTHWHLGKLEHVNYLKTHTTVSLVQAATEVASKVFD